MNSLFLISQDQIEMSEGEDCFQEASCEVVTQSDNGEGSKILRKYWKNKDEEGLNILGHEKYSIQPDMIFGWKPKINYAYSIPLSYQNQYVRQLKLLLQKDDRYKIAYLGHKHNTSALLNSAYHFPWKNRQRYNADMIEEERQIHTEMDQIDRKLVVSNCQYVFDAEFQSGNLDLAIRVKKNEYDLFIRSDTNTRGHTNWFYFTVSNKENLGEITLNICNFGKPKNLYNKGMKPYTKLSNKEWSQDEIYDVMFTQRYCRYVENKKANHLQFKYKFIEKHQEIKIAYGIPYTYSDMHSFVKTTIEKHQDQKETTVKSIKLCESLGGLAVPLLVISNQQQMHHSNQISTQPSSLEQNDRNHHYSKKKAIMITCRIHPGQSNASHLLEGFIKKITSKSKQSEELLKNFVVYIVPMLNPDGVVAGNFRTSYSGKDLNRQFNNLNKILFPQITSLCNFVEELKKKHLKGLQYYFDFHGHSSKKGLFCYGPEYPTNKIQYFKCRGLAKKIQQSTPVFSYKRSLFTVNEQKKNTARAYMLWKIKIPMTYTFQISNGLYEVSKQCKTIKLSKKNIEEAGAGILNGLSNFVSINFKGASKFIKAKIDTNIQNAKLTIKRSIQSSKEMRKKSSEKERNDVINQKFNRTKSISKELESNKKEISVQLGDENPKENQFMKLIKQIKQQQLENKIQKDTFSYKNEDQVEGGSDSEGEEDDLFEDQHINLCKMIQNKEILTQQRKKMNQSQGNVYNYALNHQKHQKAKEMLSYRIRKNKIDLIKRKHQSFQLMKQKQYSDSLTLANKMLSLFDKNKDKIERKVSFENKENFGENKLLIINGKLSNLLNCKQRRSMNIPRKIVQHKQAAIEYQKVVLVQKNFTLEL